LDELSFKRAHFIRSLQKTRDLCPPISTQHVSLAHQITKGWKHTITPNSDTQPTKTHPLSITTSPTQPATTVATNRLAGVVGVDLSRQWVTAQTKGLARRPPPDPGGGRAVAPCTRGSNLATPQWLGVAAWPTLGPRRADPSRLGTTHLVRLRRVVVFFLKFRRLHVTWKAPVQLWSCRSREGHSP